MNRPRAVVLENRVGHGGGARADVESATPNGALEHRGTNAPRSGGLDATLVADEIARDHAHPGRGEPECPAPVETTITKTVANVGGELQVSQGRVGDGHPDASTGAL